MNVLRAVESTTTSCPVDEWMDGLDWVGLICSCQVSIFANQGLGLLFPVTTVPELLISMQVPGVNPSDPICFFDAGVQDFPGMDRSTD